jgi:hypothetical protein
VDSLSISVVVCGLGAVVEDDDFAFGAVVVVEDVAVESLPATSN